MTPTHEKKLRSDSKFAALSEKQRSELAELLLSGEASQADALGWLAARGVKVSAQSLSEYYRLRVLPLKWRFMSAAASELNKISADEAADATHRAIAQATFELATSGEPLNPKQVSALYNLVLKGQRMRLDSRKVDLLEKKAAQADAAAAALQDTALTPEERERRVREVFGLL